MIRLTSKALQSEFVVLRDSCEIKRKSTLSYALFGTLIFTGGIFSFLIKLLKKMIFPSGKSIFVRSFLNLFTSIGLLLGLKEKCFLISKSVNITREKMVCLTAKDIQQVKQIHPDIILRRIQSEEEWLELEKKQAERVNPEERDPSFLNFNKQRFKDYKAMVDKHLGDWFIADLEGKWVGDLGLFYGEGLACYQNVTTYPGFEGRGIAHALVHASAKYALKNYPIEELVIVADENSRAEKIYQNLGFQLIERRANLYRNLT